MLKHVSTDAGPSSFSHAMETPRRSQVASNERTFFAQPGCVRDRLRERHPNSALPVVTPLPAQQSTATRLPQLKITLMLSGDQKGRPFQRTDCPPTAFLAATDQLDGSEVCDMRSLSLPWLVVRPDPYESPLPSLQTPRRRRGNTGSY